MTDCFVLWGLQQLYALTVVTVQSYIPQYETRSDSTPALTLAAKLFLMPAEFVAAAVWLTVKLLLVPDSVSKSAMQMQKRVLKNANVSQ